MLKRTKIIATIGPACDDFDTLKAMTEAGMDLVRFNFSHGTLEAHRRRLKIIRECAQALGTELGVLADLQGPKIRIGRFKEGKVFLEAGQQFIVDTQCPEDAGDSRRVGVNYKTLPQELKPDDTLLLADGLLELLVKDIQGSEIQCEVIVGGELSDHKGINRRGGGLSAPSITKKDKQDLKHAVAMGVDYIALSFVRDASDVHQAQKLIEEAGGHCGTIAKIERSEALHALDDIITTSDGVMVARGDLALEIGEAEVPGVQKHIIDCCRALDRPVITATQMMESMINSSVPTRAEVSDVANAVLDYTDAVMLSAETATGRYPIETIRAMARACLGAEKHPRMLVSGHRVECWFNRIDEAIAMAAMYTANHMAIKAIICLTESGATPLWMSRIRSGIPIFGLTRHQRSRGRMTLYRGVYPIAFDVTNVTRAEVNTKAVAKLQELGYVEEGDWVVLTKGDYMGVHGGTNALKIIEVGRTGY